MTTLTFQNTTLSVQIHNNQSFLTASDLGCALEYADPTKAIVKIYDRNADEFTPEMTALVEMQTAGGKQQVRIFSLRGAHLIAMFARTKVAKDFRKWVLDILDREISQNQQQIAPVIIEKKFTPTLTESELKSLCWLWKMAKIMSKFIRAVQRPLELLGSKYSAAAWGYGNEYSLSIEVARKILERETRTITTDTMDSNGWNNVIHELRKGDVNTHY